MKTANCCAVDAVVDHMNFLMMAAHDTITVQRDLAAMAAGREPRLAGEGPAGIARGHRR